MLMTKGHRIRSNVTFPGKGLFLHFLRAGTLTRNLRMVWDMANLISPRCALYVTLRDGIIICLGMC